MKIGEWWVVYADKGRARGADTNPSEAWHTAYFHSLAVGFDAWMCKVKKRGWTCEKVTITRPK